MDVYVLRRRASAGAPANIDVIWPEYERWLKSTFPRIAANLKPPATATQAALAEIERILGVSLPAQLSALYRLTGGEPRFREHAVSPIGHGVLFGARLMQARDILEKVQAPRDWRPDGVDADSEDDDFPNTLLEPTKLRAAGWHRLWVPFVDLAGGNYLAVDLAPAPGGSVGQIINVGRNQDYRFVLADSISELVALLHEIGAAGIFEIIEGDDGDELATATVFGPTELSLTDQLRRWFFPEVLRGS